MESGRAGQAQTTNQGQEPLPSREVSIRSNKKLNREIRSVVVLQSLYCRAQKYKSSLHDSNFAGVGKLFA